MLLESLELIAAATGNTDLYDRSQLWLAQWIEQDVLAPHVLEVAAGRAWRSGLPGRAVDIATRAMDIEPASESVFGWGLLGAMEMGLESEGTAVRLRESFDASVTEEHEVELGALRGNGVGGSQDSYAHIGEERPLLAREEVPAKAEAHTQAVCGIATAVVERPQPAFE